jgi:hypothetical protein
MKMYLENGTEVKVIEKISDTHALVKVTITERDFEGNWEEFYSDEVVYKRVYKTPPTVKVKENIAALLLKEKELLSTTSTLQDSIRKQSIELSNMNQKLVKIHNQTTDVNKMIYNRSQFKNTKRIVVWSDKVILPIIMEGEKLSKALHGFKIAIEYNIFNGEERVWTSKLYHKDSSWTSSTYFDQQYGIEFETTDEELEVKIKERVAFYPIDHFGEYQIKDADPKYLTPELIEKKLTLMAIQKNKDKDNLERSIREAQEKLDNLLKQSL